MDSKQRDANLALIKAWLKTNHIDALYLTSEDSHYSEFLPNLRQQIIGFEGSFGILAFYRLAPDEEYQVGFWTDGRYHIEAENLLKGSQVTLFKLGMAGVEAPESWIFRNLSRGATLFIDGSTISEENYLSLSGIAALKEITIVTNLKTFSSMPHFGINEPVFSPPYLLAQNFCGESSQSRLERIFLQLKSLDCSALLISQLDTIAWLLNLRGDDIPHTPLFYSLLFLSEDQKILYLKSEDNSPDLLQYLASLSIEVLPYPQQGEEISLSLLRIACNPKTTPHALVSQLQSQNILTLSKNEVFSFLEEMQAIRGEKELQWLQKAAKIDALALKLLENEIILRLKNQGSLTELEISELSHQCRATAIHKLRDSLSLPPDAAYTGASFEAIVGVGANGAIVHYAPTPETEASLYYDQPLLLDSGAQYNFGTTDITRIFYFPHPTHPSNISKELINAYTLVLKGHLALERMRFPEGTLGIQLDSFARQYLWNEGMNYLHGTGHGVGYFLNVHEGPHSISPRLNSQPLKAGMVVTNEPGYYLQDQFGIRIENMLVVVSDPLYKGFLTFKTLTEYPYQPLLINFDLITPIEKAQIDAQ